MKLPSLFVMLIGIACTGIALAAAEKTEPPKEAAVDVTGVWKVDVEFSGGGGNPVFTFKQDGDKLTGRYAGAFGEADVTGTIKGHDIKFGVTIAAQGVQEDYAGTVAGDTMKGKFTISGMGEGTFTGTREPKK